MHDRRAGGKWRKQRRGGDHDEIEAAVVEARDEVTDLLLHESHRNHDVGAAAKRGEKAGFVRTRRMVRQRLVGNAIERAELLEPYLSELGGQFRQQFRSRTASPGDHCDMRYA